jgi:hypothetical protein
MLPCPLQAKNPCCTDVLNALDEGEAVVSATRDAIAAILSTNLQGPLALQHAFEAVQQQLDAADGEFGHLQGWIAGGHSMQETAAEIDRLQQVGWPGFGYPLAFLAHLHCC